MNPFRLWVYLQTAPLFWLTATLGAYLIADALARAVGRHPLANTVLISVALLAVLLKISATDYQTYFNGAQFVHFLLGPATVALAVPLDRNLALVRENLLPMAAALVVGALVAIVSVVVIAAALGAPRVVLISLAPKSVTAAVAMAVSERAGGLPSLTAALVILTGRNRRHRGDADDERAPHPRLRRARLRGGHRQPRDRDRARVHCRSPRGRFRGDCDGTERRRNAHHGSPYFALVDPVVVSPLRVASDGKRMHPDVESQHMPLVWQRMRRRPSASMSRWFPAPESSTSCARLGLGQAAKRAT